MKKVYMRGAKDMSPETLKRPQQKLVTILILF
jgi:hypothetical protein